MYGRRRRSFRSRRSFRGRSRYSRGYGRRPGRRSRMRRGKRLLKIGYRM